MGDLFSNKYDWDIDLAFGQVGEKKLYDILKDEKIEVKRDRIALKTGNMAIEYMQKGRPSGIATTEATHWCYIFHNDGNDVAYVIIPTERLKQVAREAYKEGNIKHCGDNENVVVLVPIMNVFKLRL
tara:strand:- start:528 stop:908 length:381 start_codon:yes stop_codon:yes gene_type:complete